MKRTAAREIAVRLCFAVSQNPCSTDEMIDEMFREEYYKTLGEEDGLYRQVPDEKQLGYIKRIVTGVQENTEQLDGYISRYSVGWKLRRIPATARAIMRVAMYEVLYMPDVPERAAINEAIELSKHYETPETCAFINGILGSFSRARHSEAQPEAEDAGKPEAEELSTQPPGGKNETVSDG